MKVACPHCKRYYSLDQDKTGIIETSGTTLHCELCGAVSTILILRVHSVSEARRIAVQAKSKEGGED